MLNAEHLAMEREAQAAALPDVCTIQAPTTAQNAIGEPVATWVATVTDVPCRLAQRERERERAGRDVVVGDWVLTLAWDQAVDTAQRVIVGARVFEVVGTNDSESWRTAMRVDLVEVR